MFLELSCGGGRGVYSNVIRTKPTKLVSSGCRTTSGPFVHLPFN